MATYLLLRNNKQQGPLSLQHLIQLGLKPYDLVWVDGKSAAWRYPSEIPELKPYTDVVEEQPYDRFYKKPEAQPEPEPVIVEQRKPEPVIVEQRRQEAVVKHMIPEKKSSMPDIVFPDENPGYADEIRKTANANPSYHQTTFTEAPIQYPKEEPMPELEKQHEKYYPKKTVYVTLPLPQTPEQSYAPKQEPVFNFQSSPPIPDTREEPLTLKTKYEQPLDELKEQYANKLLERKKQSFQKKFITESLKKAAVIIAIISVGVLIGFAIKPSKEGNNGIADNPVPSTAAIGLPDANTNTEEQTQQQTQPVEPPDETPSEKITRKEPVYQQPEKSEPVTKSFEEPIVENKKAVMTKQQPVTQNQEPDFSEPAPSVDKNVSTGERTMKKRQGGSSNSSSDPTTTYEKTESRNNDENESSQGNIGSYVNIKSNNYHVVALGGIRNLQLTVSNDSKYVLDNVSVRVEYLKANQDLFKSEVVHFKSVAPNGTLTIRMPDTNRGMKVEYKIIKVDSKEYRDDVAGL